MAEYIILCAVISVVLWIFDMTFLAGHQGRGEAGISLRSYLFTRRKLIALLLGLAVSAAGGALSQLYEFSLYAACVRCAMLNVMCFLAWVDRREMIVPNRYIAVCLISGAVLLAVRCLWLIASGGGASSALLSSALGMASGFVCMALGRLVSRGGIGAGDVKLMLVAGLFLGFRDCYVLIMLAVVIAAIYSLVQLARKKITVRQELPFVPFMALSAAVMVLAGV